MTLVAVAPDVRNRGFDGSGREVRACYAVMDLRAALERAYKTDAHLVTYVVRGAERQPRLRKCGLPHFQGVVETHAFFCDIDNPDHSDWTDALRAEARKVESLPILATAGIYDTPRGWRIVQPIAEPLLVQHVEAYLKRWLMQLEAAGLPVDWACRDWTRHFRLPHVRRAGADFRSPRVLLDRMRPIALEPIADAPLVDKPRAARAQPPPVAWTAEVPSFWHARVRVIAEAVREEHGNWHELFLAVSGALLARGVPGEHLPALARAISIATGADARTDDRERAARSTVERYALGDRITGYSTLRLRWPKVAAALDAALATGAVARLRAQARSSPKVEIPTLAETTAALEDAIRHAPDGVTLIKAECGLGKTQAAIKIAKERADRPYASPTASGTRAPLQSKTAISVDKNSLARQVAEDLRAAGAKVRRVFGPLSVVDDQGKRVCRYADAAEHLVAGGQSLRWELCLGRGKERCRYYGTCAAREGIDGPDDARITVGPHALLRELDAAAGATGLLVIDEPPPPLENVVLGAEDLRVAMAHLGSFDSAYGDAMTKVLAEAKRWLAADEPPIVSEELRAAAEKATKADRRAPPLTRLSICVARESVAYARALGKASHVMGSLHRALVAKTPAVRVEERGELRALVLTLPNEGLERALKRHGSVVVTDANVDVNAPIYARILGYEPRLHAFTAEDGAPIRRTVLRYGQANRRAWFARGKLVVEAGVLSALRAALAWANEAAATRSLGIITARPVELAIAATLDPDNAELARRWVQDAKQDAEALPSICEQLRPVLAAFAGEIRLGHYGAVRGLDAMSDVDAIITLGDPWPNLGDVQHEVVFLGLEACWQARAEALCRAELEQAHGRIRAIHRKRPGRALHVGSVLPSGRAWTSGDVEPRTMRPGPMPAASAMSLEVLRAAVAALGGARAAARVLGCAPATMISYAAGKRPIPLAVATALRGQGPTRSEVTTSSL